MDNYDKLKTDYDNLRDKADMVKLAWDAIAKMREKGCVTILTITDEKTRITVHAQDGRRISRAIVPFEDVPEAICLAALKAKENV